MKQTTGALNDVLATFSSYTATHRPQTIVDAAGQTTTATYNSAGQVLTITNPKSETTTYTYNGDGELTDVLGPVSGATAAYTYDGYGRVATVTNADSDTIQVAYDAFDRVTTVTYPDSTTEVRAYSRLDVASVRDRLGRFTRYYYDALGRLTLTRDPLGRTIQQQWCACGAMSKLLDGLGQVTTWTYDLDGRVVSEVRDTGATKSFTYESLAGRLKTITDPALQVTTYTYAVDDAVTSIAYTNATISTPTATFTYDSQYPRQASMVDGSGTTTFTYRSIGTLGAGQVSTVDGPLANDTLTYTYDQLGRVLTRTVNAIGLTWAYDALGRQSSEVNPLGTFTHTYVGATGRLASTAYPNGQSTSYSYFGGTGDRRLQTLHHTLSGGATLSRFDYTYDAVGNVASWRQELGASPAAEWTFAYDAADQLTGAIKRAVASPYTVQQQLGYGYDAAGNRTAEQNDGVLTGTTVNRLNRLVSQQPAGVMQIAGALNEAGSVTIDGKPAAVDATHRFSGSKAIASGANSFTLVATDAAGNATTKIYDLTSSGATKTFTYDANGNLTADGTKTYEWDAGNRLVAINNGTGRSEFSYDGRSRRVRIVEKASGVTTRDARFLWANEVIVEERLSTGEINRFFRDGEQHNGTTKFVTRDHLGSVREVTNTAGTLLTQNDYDPYGRLTRVAGSEDSRFGYTGHYAHMPSGLALAWYRAYDANLGRWLSEDPASFIDGPNVYAYVGGDPTTRADTLGLEWFRPESHEYIAGRIGDPWLAPGTLRGRILEDYVPAIHTLAEIHDASVPLGTAYLVRLGLSEKWADRLANVPTIPGTWLQALGLEAVNSLLVTLGRRTRRPTGYHEHPRLLPYRPRLEVPKFCSL